MLIAQSGKVTIEIKNDNSSFQDILLNSEFPKLHIPGYKCFNIANGIQQTDAIVYVTQPKRNSTAGINVITDNGILIYTIALDEPNLLEAVYSLLPIFEYVRQLKYQEYSFHGASAVSNNHGVVFLGQSGSGKTNITRHFIDSGWSFIADERVVLQNLEIVDGNIFSRSRKNLVYNRQYQIQRTPISLIIFPKLTTSNDFFAAQYKDFDASIKIYYEASTMIRSIGIRVNEFSLAPLDTQEIGDRRLIWARTLVEKIPVYYLEGNEKDIFAKVNELLK